jgi:hypothetical protein
VVYKKLVKDRISDSVFVKTCKESISMSVAAAKLSLHFNSFKKRAVQLGCYSTNKAGKGIRKKSPKIPIEEIIFECRHPQYQSYKLKQRLYEEGFKKSNCEKCNLSDWCDSPLNLELHHIDGNRQNHSFNNLMLLCPNCHSQTTTFRAKNKKI